MLQNLITIDELIDKALLRGVNFGKGDPRIHIAYLSSLGILPRALKRKINEKIVGCYDKSVIDRLEQAENLKKEGYTYSQIKTRLEAKADKISEGAVRNFAHTITNSTSTGNFVFLTIGLILGFLLASTSISTKDRTMTTPSSSLDAAATEMLRLVYSKSNSSTDTGPIYIINLPDQNLDRIGKTSILKLNN